MSQDNLAGTSVCFWVKGLLSALQELLRKPASTSFSKVMASYMLLRNRICQSQALGTRYVHISPLLQQKIVVDAGGLLEGKEGVVSAASDRSANMDDGFLYIHCFMFDCLHSFVLISNHYLDYDMWSELL